MLPEPAEEPVAVLVLPLLQAARTGAALAVAARIEPYFSSSLRENLIAGDSSLIIGFSPRPLLTGRNLFRRSAMAGWRRSISLRSGAGAGLRLRLCLAFPPASAALS